MDLRFAGVSIVPGKTTFAVSPVLVFEAATVRTSITRADLKPHTHESGVRLDAARLPIAMMRPSRFTQMRDGGPQDVKRRSEFRSRICPKWHVSLCHALTASKSAQQVHRTFSLPKRHDGFNRLADSRRAGEITAKERTWAPEIFLGDAP